VAVVGDRIFLSSLRHPSLNITFTINLWVHFVAMLKDVHDAARFRLLKREVYVCREVSFCRHLGKGYNVTMLYCKHVLEFCQYYVWQVRKSARSIPARVALALTC